MCVIIIIKLSNYIITEEKESLLQVNENLGKKLQELEVRLTDTNDELKKTKEALEIAKNTIARCKEENTSLENTLSQCHTQHVLQADATSSRQKDVMIIFSNLIFKQLIIFVFSIYYFLSTYIIRCIL